MMMLYHATKEEKLEVSLRAMRSDDAGAVIACIRDAYGDTYVKPYLYSEQDLMEHQNRGELVFSVAETATGEIAGITASECSLHFPGQLEIVCQVIRRAYSGFGLALPLALFQLRRAESDGPDSVFARALGCHLISQKTLSSMGFTHCGFLLSVFDKEKFISPAQMGEYVKTCQLVAVKRGRKIDAGTLCLPDDLAGLARTMYQDLGVDWHTETSNTSPMASKTQWDREQDERHCTLTLWARRFGPDFDDCLALELDTTRSLGSMQTINLYLNLSESGCHSAYATARRLGFLFTGFLPCSAAGEYVILHHPLAVPIAMDAIPYLPAYEPFATEIRRQLYGSTGQVS